MCRWLRGWRQICHTKHMLVSGRELAHGFHRQVSEGGPRHPPQLTVSGPESLVLTYPWHAVMCRVKSAGRYRGCSCTGERSAANGW